MSAYPAAMPTLNWGGDPIQPEFDNFWADALQRYKTEAGKGLLEFPFARDLITRPLSTDGIIQYIEDLSKSFEAFRTSGQRVLGVLEPIVRCVHLFIDASAEAAAASNVIPGGKTIFVAIGVLLQAAKGVTKLYDEIESLFKRIRDYISRVSNYLQPSAPPSPDLIDVLIRTFVQVLNVLAIATKYCNMAVGSKSGVKNAATVFFRRAKDYAGVIIGREDVTEALKKLEVLTDAELLAAVAQNNVIARSTQPKVFAIYDSTVLKDLRTWLRPPNSQPLNYERMRKSGSCEWFFDDQFEKWKACKDGMYWVYGNAGAGKSVLCSSVIDTLKSDPDLFLAYFYFDFSDPEKQDHCALVSSFVIQIGTHSNTCLDYLGKELDLSFNPPNYEKLLAMVSQLLSLSGQTFLVIDALDECPESARGTGLLDFLEHLHGLQSKDDIDLRVFVTSRLEPDIRARISRLTTHSMCFHDTIKHKNDLANYVSAQLFDKETQSYSGWSDAIRTKARQVLVERSNGMFLWVDLQLRDLKRCAPDDVEDALDGLPSDLERTYERILKNFPSRALIIDRVRHIFECVALAKRPLFLEEVIEMFFVKFDALAQPYVTADSKMHIDDPEMFLLEKCPGLLAVVCSEDGQHKTVQFIHFSVQEYLMSTRLHATPHNGPVGLYSFDEPSANLTLARVSLSALASDTAFPKFRQYANEYWFVHVSAQNEDALGELLSRFLHMGSPLFEVWARTRYDSGTALHWAARLGLRRSISRMFTQLQGDLSISTNNCSGQIGVTHIDIVHEHTEGDRTRLHYTLSSESSSPESRVLSQNPNSNSVSDVVVIQCRARDSHGRTALHMAAIEGQAEVLSTLLACGGLVDDADNSGNTPLHHAVRLGHLTIVHFILACPAADESDGSAARRCRARNNYGRTPLHLAAIAGHANIARTLLQVYGALIDDIDNSMDTPLHYAARYGHLNVTRLLLEFSAREVSGTAAQAYCRIRKWSGQGALHLAAREGHFEISRTLLDYGASIDDTDDNGETPLHIAVYWGHLDVVRLLITADGTDRAVSQCRARDQQGQTPLHYAVQSVLSNREDIVCCLLDHGALIDNESHEELLQLAVRENHADVVHVLMEHRATRRLLPAVHPVDGGRSKGILPVDLDGDVDIDYLDLPYCF